jgi:hypothetical protein
VVPSALAQLSAVLGSTEVSTEVPGVTAPAALA